MGNRRRWGPDPDRSIEGRLVSGANQFGTAQFQVNVYTSGSQNDAAVGGFGGTVSIVWEGFENDF